MTAQRDLDSYAHVYRGMWSKSEGDPARCRAAVHDGGRSVGFHQCGRKPVVERTLAKGTFGFCRQHDPVAVRDRRIAQDRKWREEWDRETRQRQLAVDRQKARDDCVAALREIEAGHNDPRQLARATLARLDALYPTPGGEVPGKQEDTQCPSIS